MMFARRRPLTFRQKLRCALWPSRGFARAGRYYMHRLRRLQGSPGFIARGIAVGTAVSFTPFIGFHFLIGAVLCLLLRGSLVGMALTAVVVGNPWFMPLILVADYQLGHAMLGHDIAQSAQAADFSFAMLRDAPEAFWQEYLLPMMLGAAPLVVFSAALAFLLSHRAIARGRAG